MDTNPPTYADSDSPLRSFVQPRGNLLPRSPYLNVDTHFDTKPEFILPEGASKQRGRFELAFGQIGACCMLGAAFGGTGGFVNGLKQTTLAGQTGKLRRTQVLNHVMKGGAAKANTLGVLAVMYSGFGVILSYARGTDDELNTLAAGTATGLLYKSTSGLKKCGIGGAIGLSLATLWCLVTSRDRFQSMMT
ncbi:mitochondrial import inner membrane translocase subunit Tim23-like isoform X2 [Cimex lectularius]|uniref:Mitochondrial import inner membrane translocase subunit Tim23 n=1 Tax=Cimex lectularius TaxID=79782 RepID=A0A8I6S571_CIMLE|nr:mitochondrial import inner membrane translocase subunit Tim23-like isoform X2 [Cimex lectularius]